MSYIRQLPKQRAQYSNIFVYQKILISQSFILFFLARDKRYIWSLKFHMIQILHLLNRNPQTPRGPFIQILFFFNVRLIFLYFCNILLHEWLIFNCLMIFCALFFYLLLIFIFSTITERVPSFIRDRDGFPSVAGGVRGGEKEKT